MQFKNANYTECPACHAQWRDIEITMQACETCLYIAMPLPADTVDVDRFASFDGTNQHFAEKPYPKNV